MLKISAPRKCVITFQFAVICTDTNRSACLSARTYCDRYITIVTQRSEHTPFGAIHQSIGQTLHSLDDHSKHSCNGVLRRWSADYQPSRFAMVALSQQIVSWQNLVGLLRCCCDNGNICHKPLPALLLPVVRRVFFWPDHGLDRPIILCVDPCPEKVEQGRAGIDPD